MAIKSLSIRIDEEMLHKLHVVADYEGRSANSQILVLIRDCIKQFEKENGPIFPNHDSSGTSHNNWSSEQKPKMRPPIIGGRIFLYGNRSSAAAAADFGSAAVRQQQSNSLAAVAALCRIPVPVILGDRMELSCPLFPDICSVCRTGKKWDIAPPQPKITGYLHQISSCWKTGPKSVKSGWMYQLHFLTESSIMITE